MIKKIILAITILLSHHHLSAWNFRHLPRCKQNFKESIRSALLQLETITDDSKTQPDKVTETKDWNLIIYMAANNNLHKYALKNIRQLLMAGSSESINVLLQLDEYGETEVSRFFVEKNKAVIKETLTDPRYAISGTQESLYNFLEWAITKYPAKHQAILIWNHGSGIKDPCIWGKIYRENRDDFFETNIETGLLHINRLALRSTLEKGIAFNDTHQEYINNQELRCCLKDVSEKLLNHQKIDIIFLDACHMAMIEFGSKFKDLAHYFVGSEEIEPGSGYNYQGLLAPFADGKTLTPEKFAIHAVTAYAKEYQNKLADFTQSAIALDNFEQVEQSFSAFSSFLSSLLEKNRAYFSIIKKIRKNDIYTTEFCDWDYIDTIHFLKSLILECGMAIDEDDNKDLPLEELEHLQSLAIDSASSISQQIIAHASGIGLPHAYGLSIYFPEKNIHRSYEKTIFSQTTTWIDLLHMYFKRKKK